MDDSNTSSDRSPIPFEPEELAALLSCPDCFGNVEALRAGGVLAALACRACAIVFPICDGIPILLTAASRSAPLERDLLTELRRKFIEEDRKEHATLVENTIATVDKSAGIPSWAWEDEVFWREEYAAERKSPQRKNWNDRLWQREDAVRALLSRTSLGGATVLDVGSGDGYTFRELLLPHCSERTTYIGTDISIDALRLNRSRNSHKRALYVLCGADTLPVRDKSIDLLCFFGILHHTEMKSENIARATKLVRHRGFIFLHEALCRPSPLPPILRRKIEASAHEERVEESSLWSAVRSADVEVVTARRSGSGAFGGLMRFFPKQMTAHKRLFKTALNLDAAIVATVGSFLPALGAGEIVCLLQTR